MKNFKLVAKWSAVAYIFGVIAYGAYGGISLGGLGWATGDTLLLIYILARK